MHIIRSVLSNREDVRSTLVPFLSFFKEYCLSLPGFHEALDWIVG